DQIGGEGEREKGGQRRSSHGREVAEAAGEAAMTDRFRRVKVAAEVPSFKGKVCGDKDFGVRRRAQNSTIVADAKGDRPTSRGAEVAADLFDQG
ncbi:MAG TPA: hypothetical protein VN039_10815, partial [Nitrospira sp.]|nr:hypothetical protein [Nitrospira sp.]